MSIASEIARLQGAKADIKAAIEAKGVTVPSAALLDTYDTYISQISGGGGQGNPLFVTYLRGDGRAYIDTGIDLSGVPYEIETIAGSIGRIRNEEPIFSNWTSTYNYLNVFFTGDDSNRRVCFYAGGNNYINAAGWYDFYTVKLAYDGNDQYTASVDNTSVTIFKPNINPTTLKLFVRGDLNSSSISTVMLKTVTVKWGNALENVRTFKPCIYNGVSGMWVDELNTFHGNDAGTGFFFTE